MISTKTVDTKEQLAAPSQRTLPTNPFPRKYLHCVFDDWEEAVLGYHILKKAGYATKDIHILASEDYVEAIEQGQTLLSFLISSDLDVYLQEARRGHHILVVHIARYEQMKQVRNLLLSHRVHLMKYVDTWTTVDLLR